MSKQNTALRDQEVKVRIMLDAKKEEDNALAVAKWESMLPTKSAIAEKKRQEEAFKKDAKTINEHIKRIRRQKLKELYETDDECYEKELRSMNLAFRRERL